MWGVPIEYIFSHILSVGFLFLLGHLRTSHPHTSGPHTHTPPHSQSDNLSQSVLQSESVGFSQSVSVSQSQSVSPSQSVSVRQSQSVSVKSGPYTQPAVGATISLNHCSYRSHSALRAPLQGGIGISSPPSGGRGSNDSSQSLLLLQPQRS